MGLLSDPVTTRSDKHACGKPMPAVHDKQATGNREPANEMNKEDPTQGIPVWLQPFTVTWRRMCSHIPLKEWTQIRKVMLQKWRHKTEAQCSCLHPQKKKKQKRSILRTEKYGDLTTAVVVQSSIRCRGTRSRHSVESVSNQNFTGDGEEFTTVLTAVAEAKSYSHVQIIWIWQVLWRVIMESSNNYTSSIRDKRNWRTSCTSSKRRDISSTVANLDRMISGGRILWNAVAICERTKTSWQTGHLKMNEENPLENPGLGRALFAEGMFGKKILWLLRLKNWKSWVHQNVWYIPEDWMRKKSW